MANLWDFVFDLFHMIVDSVPRVVDIFTSPLRDVIDYYIEIPLLDGLLDRVVQNFVGDFSLIEFIFGIGFTYFVVYVVVKFFMDFFNFS